jgi:hypothetical protein
MADRRTFAPLVQVPGRSLERLRNAQNTGNAHGSALGADEVAATKKVLHEALDFAFLDVDVTNGKTFEVAQILEHKRVPFVFISGSPQDGLAVDRMPVADSKGGLNYERTFSADVVPDGLVEHLSSLHVVQHGIDANLFLAPGEGEADAVAADGSGARRRMIGHGYLSSTTGSKSRHRSHRWPDGTRLIRLANADTENCPANY